MDYTPPGSSVHGILQARRLEWVAISSSRDLPDPGLEPEAALQMESLPLSHRGSPLRQSYISVIYNGEFYNC